MSKKDRTTIKVNGRTIRVGVDAKVTSANGDEITVSAGRRITMNTPAGTVRITRSQNGNGGLVIESDGDLDIHR